MRSTSPLPLPANHQHDCMSAATKRYKYLRRMLKFDQMDFEFAAWQMLYLFIAPQKVYKNFHYRKRKSFILQCSHTKLIWLSETKSQFARDDPAFLVLFAAWLCGMIPITFIFIYHLVCHIRLYTICAN